MSLNPEELIVESFSLDDEQTSQAQIIYTVLYETEQVSCGGTCRTCNCWA